VTVNLRVRPGPGALGLLGRGRQGTGLGPADASPVPAAREALELAVAARAEAGSGTDGGLFSCGGVRLAGYAATLALREGSLTGVLVALASAEDAVRDGEQAPYASDPGPDRGRAGAAGLG